MATVSFKLNHPNKPDERSILVELYINRENRWTVATGEKVLLKHWSGTRANSKAPDYHRLNDNLGRIERELIQHWRDNISDLSRISKQTVSEIVRGKSSTTEKKRIFEALEKFLQECETGKAVNTLKMYRSLKDKLVNFDQLHPIDFDTLDFNFYDKFKKYLYGIPNPNYSKHTLWLSDTKDHYLLSTDDGGMPVGLFDDTVYKYFTNLKAFLSWSEKRGYQVHNSYKTWEIIKRKHPPISLTLGEMHLLSSKELPAHLDVARDFLLLECYTGQRISDIIRFNQKDYHDGKWTFNPKKGNRLSSKTITVHFKGYSAPALLILAKYNFKLPKLHEVTLNKNIKEACKLAGINSPTFSERWAGNKKIKITGYKYEFISTHTGRKTFITLALSHGMPVEYVMELTGISEYQTLSHYRAKFEDSSIEQYLKSVSDSIAVMKKAQ